MQIYVIVFLSILFISLVIYLSYKKRIKQDNIVNFSKLFLSFYILCLVILSGWMAFPLFFGVEPKIGTVILINLLMLACILCIIWYKNFYIIYEEEYFTYSTLLGKKYKIYYTEVDELSSKGDIIFIEAKGHTFYILNNKKFVPNIKQFIEVLRTKKG